MELEARIAAWLAGVLPGASDVTVDGLARIHGGASRETYRLRASWREGSLGRERRLILRRDPSGSLIDTDRRVEFAAYRAFHGTRVPVPEALWLELDPRWLDQPFFVMEELSGLEASPPTLLAPPYDQHAERIGQQMWGILAEIGRSDPAGLAAIVEAPALDGCWRRELDYWEHVIDEKELEPQPVIRAAIRWLRRNPPPPPPQLAVVHGDYRMGNYLCDTDGTIRGILDWEMAHVGDPLEDLAWSINDVWSWGRPGLAGGLVPRAKAVALWEAGMGRAADASALHWWELFTSVKGQAIWVTGLREYLEGSNKDPVLGLSGWALGNTQERTALATMGRLA